MSRKLFLLAVTLGQFCAITPAPARDVTFFAFAGPHYGYSDFLDKMNLVNIQAMNGLPGSAYPDDLGTIDMPRGVIIVGDLTQDGLQEEWDQFLGDYGLTGTEGLINYPVFEGRGNHDFEDGNPPVTDGIISRHGGVTYSFDWDDVHIVCCDVKIDAPILAWLADDLASVGPLRPVVLWVHFSLTYEPRWKPYELDNLEALLQGYNVIGIFTHYNDPSHEVWQGIDEYVVSAPFRALPGFAVVHITDTQMLVANYVMTKQPHDYVWSGGDWSYHHVKAIDPPPVTLTVAEVNDQFGSVSFDPAPWDANRPEYSLDTEVTLRALPFAQREFARWEIYDPNHPGDANYAAGDANNPTVVLMDSGKEVTAVFVDNFAVNVDIQGLGAVALDPDDDTYEPNTSVTLVATPAGGWHFAEWFGDLSGSTNPTSITMEADKTVTAMFVEDADEYALTIQTTGQGAVHPDSGAYASGTVVQLTPTAADGWRFKEWLGDVPDANRTDNPLALEMNRDRSVTASFAVETQTYMLSTQTDGHGSAIPGSGPYTAGVSVNVYAKPVSGWVFDRWEGDVPPGKELENPVVLLMDRDRALTGRFKAPSAEQPASPCFLTAGALMLVFVSSLVLSTPRHRSRHRDT